jgi:hypothetical protein
VRQLLNVRLVAAVVALFVLALFARAILTDDIPIVATTEPEVIERRIDLIEPIESATGSGPFTMPSSGVATEFFELTLDADRVLQITPGTFGQIDCDRLDETNRCAVLADMLGDAVVWFAILPQAPRATVELPPIIELEDGRAVFENGWRIPYARVIERDCDGEDIPTFSDFLRRFGPDSVTILDLDLETRQVTAVRCAEQTDPDDS